MYNSDKKKMNTSLLNQYILKSAKNLKLYQTFFNEDF